jgi:hypothetical protein
MALTLLGSAPNPTTTSSGTGAEGATYGNLLGVEKVQAIVHELTQAALPSLASGSQVVVATKEFEQQITKILVTLEAGTPPEESLRKGYLAFLKGYVRFQEAQPPPTFVHFKDSQGNFRLQAAAANDWDMKGRSTEVIDGDIPPQSLQQVQDSRKRLIALEGSSLDAYLRGVNCGDMPCQIPPCCGRCARCKSRP